jgi:hypothetical protein
VLRAAKIEDFDTHVKCQMRAGSLLDPLNPLSRLPCRDIARSPKELSHSGRFTVPDRGIGALEAGKFSFVWGQILLRQI